MPLDSQDLHPQAADEVIPTSTAHDRAPGDDDDDDDALSGTQRLGLALLRVQGWLGWTLIAAGLIAWLGMSQPGWGIGLLGAALILSGLPPLLIGYYRGAFGVLEGWKARGRGLLSVGLGAAALLRALL
jgi:hypothetical protein